MGGKQHLLTKEWRQSYIEYTREPSLNGLIDLISVGCTVDDYRDLLGRVEIPTADRGQLRVFRDKVLMTDVRWIDHITIKSVTDFIRNKYLYSSLLDDYLLTSTQTYATDFEQIRKWEIVSQLKVSIGQEPDAVHEVKRTIEYGSAEYFVYMVRKDSEYYGSTFLYYKHLTERIKNVTLPNLAIAKELHLYIRQMLLYLNELGEDGGTFKLSDYEKQHSDLIQAKDNVGRYIEFYESMPNIHKKQPLKLFNLACKNKTLKK